MKALLLITIIYCLTPTFASQENCVEQPSDPCAAITEYNAYVTCLDNNKRQKRSAGCPFVAQTESCEYVDCQSCQEHCIPDCPDCECPSSCRQCCSETCLTNLCCHKTCHNQCRTNYCRSECKKECKDRINQNGGEYDTDIGVNIVDNSSVITQAKHNITTIINLHNFINNTNLIDIPIKINNTNYNNITLKRSQDLRLTGGGGFGQEQKELETDPKTGEKCCYVISPRQCVKTSVHPFTKCFHYRHKKCGPFCIATIIHAQNQNYCDDTGCHNKIFYIPQVQQPKCYYTPSYPFINCGKPQTFDNCQGCYDHITPGTPTSGVHHHMRCSRCYDNRGGAAMPPGAMFQPPMMPPMGIPMPMGYPGYGGYPMMQPMMPPMMSPMAPPMPYPMYGQTGYGLPYGQPFYGQGQPYYGQQNQQIDTSEQANEILDNQSNFNELNMQYPVGSVGHYVHETVISADKLLKSGEEKNKTNLMENNIASPRYALISIDAEKTNHHEKREDKKEKRSRRRKEKHEHEHTTEKKYSNNEHKTTVEKKS